MVQTYSYHESSLFVCAYWMYCPYIDLPSEASYSLHRPRATS